MAKGGKSSASSGTRKKHAKRAAVASGVIPEEPLPKEKKLKKKDKANKKEPRQKMYIPPVKPRPAQPDPLETSGLAHTLPPDLLVVLRSFSKKATVTKTRALEDLQASWVEKALQEGEDGVLVYTLSEMLPVWVSICAFIVARLRFMRDYDSYITSPHSSFTPQDECAT